MKRMLATVAVVVVLAVPTVGWAFLSERHTAAVASSADTVPVGAQPAASVLGRNVLLRWAPTRFSDGTPVARYGVRRLGAGGTTLGCGGSVDPDGFVRCTDVAVPPGNWTYAVTGMHGAWSGAEGAPSTSVDVGSPSLSLSPAVSGPGGSLTATLASFVSGVTVTMHLDTAAGTTVGGPVAIAADGTGSGALTLPPDVAVGEHPVVAVAAPGGEQAVASVQVVRNSRSNTDPVARNDEEITRVGSAVTVRPLANDTDADSDSLRVTSVAGPGRGVATVTADGLEVRYEPAAGFVGTESFAYEVSDGRGGVARATITVTVAQELVSLPVAPRGILTTGGDATAADQVETSVRLSSNGGQVTIAETPMPGKIQNGYAFVGTQITITAPPGTVEDPLRLIFRVAASALPGGGKLDRRIDALTVFRNGAPIEKCLSAGSGSAVPDPCVLSKVYEASTDDVVVTVLSSHASRWNFGVPLASLRGGYRAVAADGGVFAFGDADFLGSMGGIDLNAAIVGMSPTAAGDGYWLVAGDGGIFTFGSSGFLGSTGDLALRGAIVDMSPTPSGRGYWLAGRDGGVFAFGDAPFLGSLAETPFAAEVVALLTTPSGLGYWLVGADGGVFAFGDAEPLGSLAGTALGAPIAGAASTATGRGYWLVGADGGVFAFGDAPFLGSLAEVALSGPVVGMIGTEEGYWVVGADGGIFSFGDAGFFGSTGDLVLNQSVVGLEG